MPTEKTRKLIRYEGRIYRVLGCRSDGALVIRPTHREYHLPIHEVWLGPDPVVIGGHHA